MKGFVNSAWYHIAMSIMKNAIFLAYEKGYRVSEDGILWGLKGNPLKIQKRGRQKYPTFSVNGVSGVTNKYGVFGIPVHKFAAFCFYGNDVWEADCVRHLNGDVGDVSKNNIVLGTHSQNNLDKEKNIRSNAAKIARKAQGKRPLNSKFSDEQIRMIKRSNLSDSELAKRFSVTRQAIWKIRKGDNYADIS